MAGNKIQGNRAEVWPPAITLPSPVQPRSVPNKAVRFGRASVTLACAGAGGWILIIALLWIMTSLHKNTADVEALINNVYFVGLACEASGFFLGLLGRAIMVGRLGVALSLCLLVVMAMLTLSDFDSSGIWIWDQRDAG